MLLSQRAISLTGKRSSGLGIRAWLMALVTAAVLPLLVFASIAAHRLATAERQATLAELEHRTEAAASTVERYLRAIHELAVTLANSPSVLSGDYAAFYDFAKRAMAAANVGRSVAVADPGGQLLLNTRRPFGEPMPRAGDQRGIAETVRRAAPQISDLFTGAVSRIPVLTIWAPILRDGKVAAVVGVTVNVEDVATVLQEERLRAGWIAQVIDRSGGIVAQTQKAPKSVGGAADPVAVAAIQAGDRGRYTLVDANGETVSASFIRLPTPGWAVAVGVRKQDLESPARRSFQFMAGLGLAALTTAGLLAYLVGRRMSAQVAHVTQAATAVGEGRRPVIESSRVRELDEVSQALLAAQALIEAREAALHKSQAQLRAATDNAELLMREVNHRAKNLLAVVQAVAQQTATEGPSRAFAEQFIERLAGLAASHDLLVGSEWRGVDTGELIRSQIAHFHDLAGSRILLEGPAVQLLPSAAQAIGMAIHELATNAAKYGSLSNQVGTVRISWRLAQDEKDAQGAGEPRFELSWVEAGGPRVAPVASHGFGQTVIVEMAEYALGARVALRYQPTGLTWHLEAPAERVCMPPKADVPGPQRVAPPAQAERGGPCGS